MRILEQQTAFDRPRHEFWSCLHPGMVDLSEWGKKETSQH
jgi:hypothetical protein